MILSDLQRLATDLRIARIEAIPKESATYLILTINGLDLYFNKSEEKSYDGYGSSNPQIIKEFEEDNP